MRIPKRVPITVFIAALAALSAALVVGALSALGSDGGHGKGLGGRRGDDRPGADQPQG